RLVGGGRHRGFLGWTTPRANENQAWLSALLDWASSLDALPRPLLRKDQQRECLRLRRRPGTRILRRRRGWRIHLGRYGVNVVVPGVVRHGAGAGLRLDGVHHGILVR